MSITVPDIDACTRRAATTAMLRRLADVLDADESHMPLHLYVGLSDHAYDRPETARVAVIDTLATALGMTAEPTQEHSVWYHLAKAQSGEVHLRVYTDITSPAERCACGAVCTHTGREG